MNDLMDEGAEVARELLERRDTAGEAHPRTLVLLLMVEAYSLGYQAGRSAVSGRESARKGGRNGAHTHKTNR